MTNQTAAELIARSNRLGADPKNTNYAGGNTSAKGTETDPVTGEPVELLWVKGSGGDLGTLKESGLAVLRLDRMRALVDVYPGLDREDEMVAAFDYCLHGKGGAAPSIDTAMHGLVDAAHVDHLHPDSGIAFATSKDGAKLTKKIFGEEGGLGAMAAARLPAGARHRRDQGEEPRGDRLHPRRPRHHRVGRHVRGGRGELAVDHRDRAGVHRRERQEGAVRQGAREVRRAARGRAPREGRRARGDDPQASRRTTSRWSATSPTTRGCSSSSPRRRRPSSPRSAPAAPITSCAPRSSRCCSTCPRTRRREGDRAAEGAARGLPRRLHGVLREARHR